MYFNDYDDYMRSVLGYNNQNDYTYCSNWNCGINYNNSNCPNYEKMYPNIYKLINPVVCRTCDNNTQPVTDFLIEQMTDSIYDNVINQIEVQNVINLNIETRNVDSEVSNKKESKEDSYRYKDSKNQSVNSMKSKEVEDVKGETRSSRQMGRNSLLRDLIRILIINRLIRPLTPPYRPGNYPPPPPPPPRPGMPGGYGPRPPMPRYDEYI